MKRTRYLCHPQLEDRDMSSHTSYRFHTILPSNINIFFKCMKTVINAYTHHCEVLDCVQLCDFLPDPPWS